MNLIARGHYHWMALLIACAMAHGAGTAAQSQLPARAAVTPTGGTGQIAGTILIDDTGSKAKRARVRLVQIGTRETFSQLTDDQGRFEFRDLGPGRYGLSATKGGFVPTQFGQRRASLPGTPNELTDGRRLTGMNIRMTPGSTIDGRVFDETGEPAVDALVMTLKAQYVGGQKRVAAVGRVLTTNEKGEFHLFGLPAGTYYLSATQLTGPSAGDAASREGYAPTYYPGTIDLGTAETVTIGEGEQRTAIDVILALVRTVNVSGTARDSEGRLFGSGTVTITNTSSGIPIPIATAPLGADGSFKIANVPPGRFTLNASSSVSPATGGMRDSATQALNVTGADVNGIVLASPKPAMLSGVLEREEAEAELVPPGVQLRAVAAEPGEDLTDVGTVIRTDPNGTFANTVRPGVLRLELAGAAPGWYLSRVMLGDKDVTDAGFRLTPNESMDGIRVMLTKRVTAITGTTMDEAGRPVTDYAVSVFSKDENHWRYRSRRITAAKADQDGRFTVRGLPPGEYLIAAMDYMEQGEGQDPEFLEQLRGNAQSLSIRPAETTSIKLRLIRR